MLTVEHLTYRYSRRGAPVLRGVDLTLESGEIGILLGCNGSGKTTLFKNLLGICTPDSGSIRFDGQELTVAGRKNAEWFFREYQGFATGRADPATGQADPA